MVFNNLRSFWIDFYYNIFIVDINFFFRFFFKFVNRFWKIKYCKYIIFGMFDVWLK